MNAVRRIFRSSPRDLGRNERGLALIEFAFVAPFLAIMIVGVADIARGYTERFKLQQAANRTIELAHLGTRTNDYSHLSAEAASAAGVLAANVTLQQWLECVNTNGSKETKAFTGTCTSAQETARYVSLEIVKSFTPVFSSAGYPNVAANGTVPLRARAALRVQ